VKLSWRLDPDPLIARPLHVERSPLVEDPKATGRQLLTTVDRLEQIGRSLVHLDQKGKRSAS